MHTHTHSRPMPPYTHTLLPSPPPRWFHGGCVKMSRDQVDSLGEGDAWDCQACKAFKRQLERAAARNQR